MTIPYRVRKGGETMGTNPMQDELITKRIMQFAVMEANDCSREDKLRDLFGLDINKSDSKEIHNADACMSRWRKTPEYEQAWKAEMRTWDFSDYRLARQVFRKAMKQDKDPWLAVNSANSAISHAGKRLFADEATAITVKIEGSMPDIGSPDDA